MRLPWTRLRLTSFNSMPSPLLPETRLAAAGVVPPTRLPTAPAEMFTPSPVLPTATVPVALVPIQLPATRLCVRRNRRYQRRRRHYPRSHCPNRPWCRRSSCFAPDTTMPVRIALRDRIGDIDADIVADDGNTVSLHRDSILSEIVDDQATDGAAGSARADVSGPTRTNPRSTIQNDQGRANEARLRGPVKNHGRGDFRQWRRRRDGPGTDCRSRNQW